MLEKEYKNLKSFYRVQRKNVLKLNNSIFGDKKYKKFIVIASGRTGSNLLISYLNSHPNIEAKGELFRDLEGSTCKEVWDDFYNNKPKIIEMAGCKIFYYHPFHTKDKSVWEFILKDRDIKIIHLVRENKLRTYLSLEIANKTDSWSRKNKKNISLNKKQVEINFDEFLDRLNKIEQYEKEARSKFKNHSFLEISYEQLVNDKEDTMKRVFDLLDLEERELKSNYKKQNKEKVSDLILNYDEFIGKLKKSKFSYLRDLAS